MSLHEVESRSVGRTGWQEARVGLSPTLGWQWEGCFSWCSTTCFKAFWVSNFGSTFSSSQMDWPLLAVTIEFLEYPILSQTPLECATLQDGMIWNGMSFPCIVSHPAAQQCSKYWSPCLAWKKNLQASCCTWSAKKSASTNFETKCYSVFDRRCDRRCWFFGDFGGVRSTTGAESWNDMPWLAVFSTR